MEFSKGLCMGCMSEIGDEKVCHICGCDNSAVDNGCGLPPRAVLGNKYIVGKVLDFGGEGITYIGKNLESGAVVRIREYFPDGICERSVDGTVSVSRENSFSYNESLICFLEMAKSLRKLNGNPNLLNVVDIFEGGNTAYFVTESISGITLREFLLRNGGQLTWEQARSLFLPLLPTVTLLHENNIIHRGLSPETLLVGRDGKVRITGFCIAAARTSRSDISARLFPGFAAIEQYGFDAQPGPWTDVYGIAATIYRTVIGNPPPEATERVVKDSMTIPAKLAETIPQNVLVALANALQIMPENRTKTIEEFKSMLTADNDGQGTPAVSDKEDDKKETFFKKYGVLTIAASAAVLLFIVIIIIALNWSKIFGGVVSGGGLTSVPTSSAVIMNEDNEVAQVIDFSGMTCVEVEEYYEKLGFPDIQIEVISKSYNDKFDLGKIYKQKQKIGKEIQSGEILEVYVSLGSEFVELPDFIKDKTSFVDAKIKLLSMGFLAENIDATGVTKLGEDDNRVFEMSPAPGTKVSRDSKIEISYYKEIEHITVANFVNKFYDDIKDNKAYSAYQFIIENEYSEVYKEGVIVEQSIPAGSKIKNTETITLKVSKGKPPKIPNLAGKLKGDAVNVLSKDGISYTTITEYSDSVPAGRVIRTNPPAGTTVATTITLYVSKGSEPKKPESSETSTTSEVTSSDESATSSDTTTTTTPENP